MRAAIIKRIERSEDRASTVERIQIWSGALTWGKKSEDSSDEIVEHQLSSYITIEETEAELSNDGWLPSPRLQLTHKSIITHLGQRYLDRSRKVEFHFSPCPELQNLIDLMRSGEAGLVHLNGRTVNVLVLFYSVEKKTFLGFIPNNQDQWHPISQLQA